MVQHAELNNSFASKLEEQYASLPGTILRSCGSEDPSKRWYGVDTSSSFSGNSMFEASDGYASSYPRCSHTCYLQCSDDGSCEDRGDEGSSVQADSRNDSES